MCWRHVSIYPLSHGIIINTLSCSSPFAPLPINVDPSKMEHLKLLSRLFTRRPRKAPDLSSMVDGRNREEINLNRFHFHFRLPNWNSPAQHKSCCCCRWKVKNASQVIRLDFGAFFYGLGKRSNKIRFFLERREDAKAPAMWFHMNLYRIPPWPLTFCKYKFAKLGLGAFAGLSIYGANTDHYWPPLRVLCVSN